MKKLILMLWAFSALGFSADAETCLRLTLANGTNSSYVLSERPVIKFPGTRMEITTAEASVSYDRTSVISMEFVEGQPASIDDITENGDFQFSYMNGIIRCSGSEISIYNLSGSMVASGHDELSTEHLNSGIYIVKTNNHTVKIIK